MSNKEQEQPAPARLSRTGRVVGGPPPTKAEAKADLAAEKAAAEKAAKEEAERLAILNQKGR